MLPSLILRRALAQPVERTHDHGGGADHNEPDGDHEIDSNGGQQHVRDGRWRSEPSARIHREQQPGGIDDHAIETYEERREALVVALDTIPAINRAFGASQSAAYEPGGEREAGDGKRELTKTDTDGDPCGRIDGSDHGRGVGTRIETARDEPAVETKNAGDEQRSRGNHRDSRTASCARCPRCRGLATNREPPREQQTRCCVQGTAGDSHQNGFHGNDDESGQDVLQVEGDQRGSSLRTRAGYTGAKRKKYPSHHEKVRYSNGRATVGS